MPCHEIADRCGKTGFICCGNEPVVIRPADREYRFEWTAWCGWAPVNKDGSGRESRVPNVIWNELERLYPKWTDKKERERGRV